MKRNIFENRATVIFSKYVADMIPKHMNNMKRKKHRFFNISTDTLPLSVYRPASSTLNCSTK